MSGYNKRTGVFELTYTKAKYWYRRESLPFEPNESMPFMNLIAKLFIHYGYKVISGGSRFLRIKANPDQVWEVLSDQKSDPERSGYYY